MRRHGFILGVLTLPLSCFGQSLTKGEINSLVSAISTDTSLQRIELDALEVYDTSFDGGGTVELIHDGLSLKAFIVQVGHSNGRLTSSFYYLDSFPIQIIEIENRYRWIEGEGAFDRTALYQTFKEIVYVLNWELGETEHEVEGKRILTEAKCGIFEYEPEVELGQKLFQQNIGR